MRYIAAALVLWVSPANAATVTISGTTDIEDSTMVDSAPDLNYGGGVGMNTGRTASAQHYRVVARIATSAIPAMSSCSLFRLDSKSHNNRTNTGGYYVEIYRVLAGNSWVEGTASGTTQTGSMDWNHTAHTSSSWNGSAGCGTSGTDYAADASPPQYAIATSYLTGDDISMTLDGSWPVGWVNGSFANEGMLFKATSEGAAESLVIPRSSEHATSQVTYYMEYTLAVGSAMMHGSVF